MAASKLRKVSRSSESTPEERLAWWCDSFGALFKAWYVLVRYHDSTDWRAGETVEEVERLLARTASRMVHAGHEVLMATDQEYAAIWPFLRDGRVQLKGGKRPPC